MTILKLQPVAYHGSRLSEVGNRLVSIFFPLIDNIEVNKEIKMEDILSELSNKPYNIASISVVVQQGFLEYLSALGEPILGITSLEAKNIAGARVYGQGIPNPKSAYVSTYYFEFGEMDSAEHLESLVIYSTHELGHSFGLNHHGEEQRSIRNKLCPMAVSRISLGPNAEVIKWEQDISLRDWLFCNDCYKNLGITPKHP